MIKQCNIYAIFFIPTQLFFLGIVGFVVCCLLLLTSCLVPYVRLSLQLQSHEQVSHSALKTFRGITVSSQRNHHGNLPLCLCMFLILAPFISCRLALLLSALHPFLCIAYCLILVEHGFQ